MPTASIVAKSSKLPGASRRVLNLWTSGIRSALHNLWANSGARILFTYPTGLLGHLFAQVARVFSRSKVTILPGCPPSVAAVLFLAIAVLTVPVPSHAVVTVDWLYDFRRLTDPTNNGNNFPVLELKVFIPQSFGAFLMKEEIDLNGPNHNVSQIYTELSQSIKLGGLTLGGLPLFAHVGYSGGLGLFSNGSGGFYTPSAFNAGPEYRFELQKTFWDASLTLRYTDVAHSNYGPMVTLYAARNFLDYKLLIANSLEAWTTPGIPNSGSSPARVGTFASWELESELWYKVAKRVSVGSYVRTTRNVYALSNRWLLYPSVGVRYAF